MKKLLLIFCAIVMLSSCADEKTFKRSDGTEFTAEPYGWMNQSKRIDGVSYDINVGNMVWNVLTVESVLVPTILTGIQLYEPVSYIEPKDKLNK